MALEELMGVEKDAHADTWGAGAVEQGRFRRTYTSGSSGCRQPQVGSAHNTAGRKKGRRTSRAGAVSERTARAEDRVPPAAVGFLPRRR